MSDATLRRSADNLADAIAAQGAPPCGTTADRANRCAFWKQCAERKHACHEFFLWQTEITVQADGTYKRNGQDRIFKVRPRIPTRVMYRKVFHDGK